jgi:hypothetical protein
MVSHNCPTLLRWLLGTIQVNMISHNHPVLLIWSLDTIQALYGFREPWHMAHIVSLHHTGVWFPTTIPYC